MKHFSQQRPMQSADNKACRQLAGYSLSRLTPSPDLSAPALRLGLDTKHYEDSNPLASNLLELYRSTDIAKEENPDDLAEGRAANDGPEGSEYDLRGEHVSFDEGTSRVVTIAASFPERECHPTSEDEDENLIAACTLAEGQQTIKTGSAVVVDGKVGLPDAPSSRELCFGKVGPLIGETTRSTSIAAWQHTQGARTHEGDKLQRKEASETDFDSRLRDAFRGRTLRSVETEYGASSAQAEYSTENRNAFFRCREADEARTVAAVRHRSLLAGSITTTGVGLLTLACISPWNVEVASSCIVGGLCICVLGWFAVSLKSQLLLVLHVTLLFCFLLMLIVTIALNFHWAVQSFRVLRHAYFDDMVSQQGVSPAQARGSPIVPSSIVSTPYIMCFNRSQDTVVSDRTAKGLANDNSTFVQRSISFIGASNRIRTLTSAQGAGSEISIPINAVLDQAVLSLPPLESHAQDAAAKMVQPLQLRQASRLAEAPLHRNTVYSGGTSYFLNNSISFVHSLDRRQPQMPEGSIDSRSKRDEVTVEAFTKGSVDRALNCPDTNKLNTSGDLVLSEPAVGAVWQAARRLETWNQPCDANDFPCILHDIRITPHFRILADTAGWTYTHPTDSREGVPDGVEVIKDKSDDIAEQASREYQQDTSSVMLLQGKRRIRDEFSQNLRQSLHLKQDRTSLRQLDSSEDEHTRRVSVALANSGSASGMQNSQSRLFKNALPVNLTGVQPTILTSACSASSERQGPSEGTDWLLEEGIVIPEPARCDNLPGSLLKYVYSTRRQLETYGMLCAFSRYDLWGLFDRWSVDCENGCGFKFLATKRYMWSTGLEKNAAAASAPAARAEDLPPSQMLPRDQAQKTGSRAASQERTVEYHGTPPCSSVATMHLTVMNAISVTYPTLEYLQWQAALPLDKQKACLEAALNVACSVVKSHYLMLLPPLAVLLLLTSLILLGVGIATLNSSFRLQCVAARRR